MSETKIMPCTCNHEYQDAHYGTKQRLHNEAKAKTPSQKTYRCSVCGTTK